MITRAFPASIEAGNDSRFLICRIFSTRTGIHFAGKCFVKLTSKAQTTIPKAVLAASHLREGGELVYVIEDDRVILTKAQPLDAPSATFSEWNSAADRKAYDGL